MPPLSPQADRPLKLASAATRRERNRTLPSRSRVGRSRPIPRSSDAHTERLLDRLVAEHARTFDRSARAVP